jgi:hypothetical protein
MKPPCCSSASRSAQSGGAHPHLRAECATVARVPPSVRRPARPTRRQKAHVLRESLFPQVLASAGDCAARPGSCRKPPGALYIESGKERVTSLPLPFAVRCGRTTSSRSGSAPRTAVRRSRTISPAPHAVLRLERTALVVLLPRHLRRLANDAAGVALDGPRPSPELVPPAARYDTGSSSPPRAISVPF